LLHELLSACRRCCSVVAVVVVVVVTGFLFQGTALEHFVISSWEIDTGAVHFITLLTGKMIAWLSQRTYSTNRQ